jgi:hypothetical protein
LNFSASTDPGVKQAISLGSKLFFILDNGFLIVDTGWSISALISLSFWCLSSASDSFPIAFSLLEFNTVSPGEIVAAFQWKGDT